MNPAPTHARLQVTCLVCAMLRAVVSRVVAFPGATHDIFGVACAAALYRGWPVYRFSACRLPLPSPLLLLPSTEHLHHPIEHRCLSIQPPALIMPPADISMSVADRAPGSLPYASHENLSMQVRLSMNPSLPNISSRTINQAPSSLTPPLSERNAKNTNVACRRRQHRRQHVSLQSQDGRHAVRCTALARILGHARA
jgi:hypothetical protein